MSIIRGWAAPPRYGELPAKVHRLLPRVAKAMDYAQARAQGFGG